MHNNHDHSSIALPRGGLQPICGWPLVAFGKLDSAAPGFLWQAMQTRPRWRQAVFAALATGIEERPIDFLRAAQGEFNDPDTWAETLAELAAALRVMKPRQIVEATFGVCPDGLLGSLDKLGFSAMSPDAYAGLISIFTADDPDTLRLRRVVQQIAHLDEDRLAAIQVLDPSLLSTTTAMRMGCRRDADRINAQAAVVRLTCSGVTEDDLRAAIGGDDRRMGNCWFSRLISSRADRLLPSELPTDGYLDFVRVTPANRERMGREFRNCLGSADMLTSRLLGGTWAMVAWMAEKLLVEITLTTDGTWIVTGLHAHANARVTRVAVEKVAERLAPLGVKCFLPARCPQDLNAVRDAFGSWDHAMIDVIDLD